jgi:hypothetical protein
MPYRLGRRRESYATFLVGFKYLILFVCFVMLLEVYISYRRMIIHCFVVGEV